MERMLISPKEAFRIGMTFKFIIQRGVTLMIYGYGNEQEKYVSSRSRSN